MSKSVGTAAKLGGHSRSVRGVSFSPKKPCLFCSGGYDGLVNFYDAANQTLLSSTSLAARGSTVSGLRFFPNGLHLAVTSHTKKLFIIDVETGKEAVQYDNCAFNGRDRVALATVVSRDGIEFAVTDTVDGKGLSFFDIRIRQPVKTFPNLHDQTIRDILFLRDDWCQEPSSLSVPYLQTASEDGKSKIIDFDGRIVKRIDLQTPLYTLAHTPEPLFSTLGYEEAMAFGGLQIIVRGKDGTTKSTFHQNQNFGPIWKLRYTSVGTELFSACDDGKVRRYRRTANQHEHLDVVLSHSNDIEDMDISITDEYLVTASQDTKVGLIRIREPTFGTSEYADLI